MFCTSGKHESGFRMARSMGNCLLELTSLKDLEPIYIYKRIIFFLFASKLSCLRPDFRNNSAVPHLLPDIWCKTSYHVQNKEKKKKKTHTNWQTDKITKSLFLNNHSPLTSTITITSYSENTRNGVKRSKKKKNKKKNK